ncbi:MAG: ribonuclease [Pseudomonadota bacterium]
MPSAAAPQWLIEQGIGETRALLVSDGEVLAARIYWPGELIAGSQHQAQLIAKAAGARRGTAVLKDGTEVLVDHLPVSLTEGARFDLEISRAPIAERGRLKQAQGRFTEVNLSHNDTYLTSTPQSEGQGTPVTADNPTRSSHFKTFLRNSPFEARVTPAFAPDQWEEVWSAASAGSIAFPGGEILLSITPAMTVIDVDGTGSPRTLALAAIPAIATALRWFDLGGNIAIDFPTLGTKADRRVIDTASAHALAEWPHERTAMNGFGLVQLVARLHGPSLLHRFATSRTGLCARFVVRIAERAVGAGPVLLLTIHPALKAKLKPDWLDELTRRTGKQLRIETDPALALEAPQAQIIGQ